MKNVLIVSTSPRKGSNSTIMGARFAGGAKDAGHNVSVIELYDKKIAYCKGCFACQKIGKCVINDDANALTESILNADVVCFTTPVYYYTMCGVMKSVIDRANSMFKKDYKFREIYVLAAADDPDEHTIDGVVNGVECWLRCYPKAKLAGSLLIGGIEDEGAVLSKEDELAKAYEMGKNL